MNAEGRKHPCQDNGSPSRMVGKQGEEAQKVRHNIRGWQHHIEDYEANQRPHSKSSSMIACFL